MGKGLIASGGEDGLYTVNVYWDKSKINERLAFIAERLTQIDVDITELEVIEGLEEDEVERLGDVANAEIDNIDTDATCEEVFTKDECIACETPEGYYKFGESGNCIYESLEACIQQNPIQLNWRFGSSGPATYASEKECQADNTLKKRLAKVNEAIELLYQVQEELRHTRSQIAFLKAEKVQLTLEQNRLQDVPDYITSSFWCADFTEDLSSYVGLIEIPGDLYVQDGAITSHMNVFPGYDGASHLPERDGVLRLPVGDIATGVTYNWAMQPGWEKWHPRYRIATITDIYHDTNEADITIEALRSSWDNLNLNYKTAYSFIPFRYMTCNSRAFKKGDRVIVEFANMEPDQAEDNWEGIPGYWAYDPSKPEEKRITIIGFAEKPRRCCDAELASVAKDLLNKAYLDTDPATNLNLVKNYGHIDWAGRNCKRVLTWDGPPVRYGDPVKDVWTTSELFVSTVEFLCDNELQEHQTVDTPNGWYVLGAGADNETDIILLEFGYPDDVATIWAHRLTPIGGDPANGYNNTLLATLPGWAPSQMAFFHPDGQYCIFLGYEEQRQPGGVNDPWQIVTFDTRYNRFNIEGGSGGNGTLSWTAQSSNNYTAHDYSQTESYQWTGVIAIDYSPQGERVWLEMTYLETASNTANNPDGNSTTYAASRNRSWSIEAKGADVGLPTMTSGNYSYTSNSYWGSPNNTVSDSETQEYIRFLGLDLRYGKAIWIDHYHNDVRTTYGNTPEGTCKISATMSTTLKLVEDGADLYTDSLSETETYDSLGSSTFTHKDRTLDMLVSVSGYAVDCPPIDEFTIPDCTLGETTVYSKWNMSLPYWPTYPLPTTLGAYGNDWPGRLAMTPKAGFLWSFALDNVDDNTFDRTHWTKLSYGDFADWDIYGWHKVDEIGLAMIVDNREMGDTRPV